MKISPAFFWLLSFCFTAQTQEGRAESTQLQLNPVITGQSASAHAIPVTLPYDKVLRGPLTDYALMTMSSTWAHEYIVKSTMLTGTGYSDAETTGESAGHTKPYWLVYNTKTNQGVALALAYAGNWSFSVKAQGQQVAIHLDTAPSGLKAFDQVGGLSIPGALTSEFTGGWDYGAQPIARYIRANLERDLGNDWPWVQYNNYYATEGNPTEATLLSAIPKAAAVGCELFTLDAGWYTGNPKADWQSSLGDWKVNPDRFPHGLGVISDAVHQAGMKFGLWFEIECASPGSEVVKNHPDWFIKDNIPRSNNRMIFDLANPRVLDYLEHVLDGCIDDFHLDYIKMDFNTCLGSKDEKDTSGNDMAYDHGRGLISIWKHLRTAHPQLVIENCSSGSLREDITPAAFTDTHWVSDQVDNHFNLAMDYGCTYLFPPEMCSHWTATPNAHDSVMDVESQFTVNMMGHFGLSGALWNWDPNTVKTLTERIALYKKIRPVIRQSDVYHLTSQVDPAHLKSIEAVLYVDAKSQRAILFAFQGGDPSLTTTLKLPGLQPTVSYQVIGSDAFGPPQTFTGEQLLNQGLKITFPHPSSSGVIQIQPANS
jgi:alpha-galactosidase